MSTNKEKLSALAQRHIEKGQYEKAIREYLKIVAEDEKDVRTWLKIGDLFVKMGQKAEAAQTYQKVARFYSEQGFYLKAVAVYKQILRMDPRLTDVNVALAGLYRQLGLVQDAIAQYETVSAFLLREGRPREAISAHQAILELDPDNLAQRIKLAELYSKENLIPEAITAFAHTAEQLRALGRLEDYLKVAERLLFHDPDNRGVAKDVAALYLQRGDPRRALTKLQAAFKADPGDVETLELLSSVFLALQQKKKCVSVLRELGRILLERGEKDQGVSAYERILQLEPEDPEARAVLAARVSGSPEAKANPSKISSSTPMTSSQASGHSGGQSGAQASGQSGGSQSSSSRPRPPSQPAQKIDEEVARTITEADVYAKYGLYQKAIDHLERALSQKPHLRMIRERLALYCEAAGRLETAVSHQWTLYSQAQTKEDAASCLSEILRLDPQNKTAIRRWHELNASGQSGPSKRPADAKTPSSTTQDAVLTTEGDPLSAPTSSSVTLSAAVIQDELDEVDFFLRQQMFKEARGLVHTLLVRYPEHPELVARLQQSLAPGAEDQEDGVSESQVLLDIDVPEVDEPQIAGTAFEVTRRGVRERGKGRQDAASFFELGVAYRDMGLYADALIEFRKALRERHQEALCHKMIGICLLELDQVAEALEAFQQLIPKTAERPQMGDQELGETYYQLGRAHERLRNLNDAMASYEEALRYNSNLAAARQRLSALRKDHSPEETP